MSAAHPTGPEVSTIGKYQLIANLGHGGMADVYLAVVHGPVGFNKLTVIKRLRPSLADEPEFLSMFLDEARLAARLNHPNVVQTNEVAEVDGIYFIAMEYLDGQPLNRILHRAVKAGDLPQGLLLRIVADSLAGLHHAHELLDYDGSPIEVVHRDASPHNIFVTYDGQTKVVDFGIAKAATRSAETRGGVLKGKIAYMAPEQARSDAVDRRADVFAMGLVTWEVLTGSRLRKGSDLEMLERIGSGEVPPLSSALPSCPPALERIIARSTAVEKEQRYATANEMRQDIVAYLDSTGERTGVEDVGKFVSKLFESKRAEMRSIIERQLTGLRRAATDDGPLRIVDMRRQTADSMELPRASLASLTTPSNTTGSSPSGTTSLPRVQTGATTGGTTSTPTSTLAAAQPAPSRSRAPLVIAAVAIGAAVTVLALRRGGEANPGPALGAATSAAMSAAPTETTAPSTTTIEIHLSAKPDQAKLFLDDTALPSNPFVGRFKRDDKPHLFRVEADGHLAAQRPLSFASDQTMEVALEKADPTRDKPGAPGSDTVPRPPVKPPPKKALDKDDPWR